MHGGLITHKDTFDSCATQPDLTTLTNEKTMSIATRIVQENRSFDTIEAAAIKQGVKNTGDGWITVYEFSDGSQIKCERSPAASEEDSKIYVLK